MKRNLFSKFITGIGFGALIDQSRNTTRRSSRSRIKIKRYRRPQKKEDLVGLSGQARIQARYTRRHRWMRRDVFAAGKGIAKADVGEMDNVQKSRTVQLILNAVRAHNARGFRLGGAVKEDYEFYIRTLPKNARKRLRKKLRRKYA